MFKETANTSFNTTERHVSKISCMHETMERLYEAAKALRKTEGQTNVANLLNESPQTVKNWESRGISAAGAIKAEIGIGCRAAWVFEGHGEMTSMAAPAIYENPEDRRVYELRVGLTTKAVELAAKFDHLGPLAQIKFWNRIDEELFAAQISGAQGDQSAESSNNSRF